MHDEFCNRCTPPDWEKNRFQPENRFIGDIEDGKRYPFGVYTKEESDAKYAVKQTEEDLTALTAEVGTKAAQADLTALTEVVGGKADSSDLAELSETVSTKADISDLSELAETVATKADNSDLEELAETVATKADSSDVSAKADKTTTDNLQAQINQIVISSEAEAVVAPEVAAARVAVDNTEYETLKERLDADYNSTFGAQNIAINNSNVAEICDSNANNLPNDKVYSVGLTSMSGISNFPDAKGCIVTFGRSKASRYNGDIQYFITYDKKLLYRIYWSSTWQSWEAVAALSSIEPTYLHSLGRITDDNVVEICGGDADNLGNNRMYALGMTDAEVENFPRLGGFIIAVGRDSTRQNGDTQLHISSTGTIRSRIYWSNVWSEWVLLINETYIKNREKDYCLGSTINITDENVTEVCDGDANNLPNNRIYGMGMSTLTTNFPQRTGCILTIGKGEARTNGDVQMHISATNTIRTRIYWGNVWGDWELNANSTYVSNREKVYLVGTGSNITNTTAEEICGNDFDSLPNNRIFGVGLTTLISHAPALKGNIVTIGKQESRTNSDIQIFTANDGTRYSRIYWSGEWTEWSSNSGGSGVPSIRVLALGDSICNGIRNNNKGFIGDVGVPYDNIGVSGATLSTKVENVKNIPQQLVDYVATNQPDAIIANGGVNDYYFSAPLGTVPTVPATDNTAAAALDRTTVLGGLQYLFYSMISLYPKAQRFFLLTHKTTAKASSTDSTIVDWTVTVNSAGYTQRELFAAIKATCDVYGVKVVDVFGESMINTAFSQCKSAVPYSEDHSVTDTELVDADGIHPLAYGYKRGYVPFVKQALFGAEPR